MQALRRVTLHPVFALLMTVVSLAIFNWPILPSILSLRPAVAYVMIFSIWAALVAVLFGIAWIQRRGDAGSEE